MGEYTEFPIQNAVLPFTPASATAPASFDFAEDTDNGTEAVTLKAADALSATYTVTLPQGTGTLALLSDVTYERLDTNGDVGTGAGQLAIGNHNHSSVYEPADALLTALAGLTTAADQMIYSTGSDAVAMTGLTSFIRTLLDDANAATARGTLGVDAAGTDNSTPVTVSGAPNYFTLSGQDLVRALVNLTTHITGTLPIANGGTNSTTSGGALTNLGGQPVDATLTAFAALTIAANSYIRGTGADAFAVDTAAASTIIARRASGNLGAQTYANIRADLTTITNTARSTSYAIVAADNVNGVAGTTNIFTGTTNTVNVNTGLGTYAAATPLHFWLWNQGSGSLTVAGSATVNLPTGKTAAVSAGGMAMLCQSATNVFTLEGNLVAA